MVLPTVARDKKHCTGRADGCGAVASSLRRASVMHRTQIFTCLSSVHSIAQSMPLRPLTHGEPCFCSQGLTRRLRELQRTLEDAEETDRQQLARVNELTSQYAALEREAADKDQDLELPQVLTAEVRRVGETRG